MFQIDFAGSILWQACSKLDLQAYFRFLIIRSILYFSKYSRITMCNVNGITLFQFMFCNYSTSQISMDTIISLFPENRKYMP